MHRPLRTSGSIRLLQVENAKSEQLIYKLVTSSIEKARDRFYALSYTWREPGIEDVIIVNGQKVLIRNNLFQFLQQLHRMEWTGLLWVDAICIDQSDIADRNHQVSLMRNIYAAARRVFVWLGPSSPTIDRFFTRCQEDFRGLSLGGLNDDIVNHDDLAALLEIVRRPYWNRIWIVQELYVGRRAFLWCGENFMLLQQMKRLVCEDWALGIFDKEDFVRDVMSRYVDVPWQGSDVVRWGFIAHLFWDYQANPDKTPHRGLSKLIYTFGHMDCQDRHDRVYALLGMSTSSEATDHSEPLKVDYEEPLTSLLVRTLDVCRRNGEVTDLSAAVDLAIFLNIHPSMSNEDSKLSINVYQPFIGAVPVDLKALDGQALVDAQVSGEITHSGIYDWLHSPSLAYCPIFSEDKVIVDSARVQPGDKLYSISPAMASINSDLRPADHDDIVLAVRQEGHDAYLVDVGIFRRTYVDGAQRSTSTFANQHQTTKLLQWRKVMEQHLGTARLTESAAEEALIITMDLALCDRLAQALRGAANSWKDGNWA